MSKNADKIIEDITTKGQSINKMSSMMETELTNVQTTRHLITTCKTEEVHHDLRHSLFQNPTHAKCTTKNAKKFAIKMPVKQLNFERSLSSISNGVKTTLTEVCKKLDAANMTKNVDYIEKSNFHLAKPQVTDSFKNDLFETLSQDCTIFSVFFPERFYSEGMEAFKRDDVCGLQVIEKETGVKTHIDLAADEQVIMPGVICTLLYKIDPIIYTLKVHDELNMNMEQCGLTLEYMPDSNSKMYQLFEQDQEIPHEKLMDPKHKISNFYTLAIQFDDLLKQFLAAKGLKID